jgi:hypothetical protein
VTDLVAFPSDGFEAAWSTWDGKHEERLTLAWENEAWTATGAVGRERIQYVVRLTAYWHVSQFLLFRDADEPDLWLGTDGGGRWGEVNGAHRTDLDGATDVALSVTPFAHAIPIRRLPLEIGDSADVATLAIDVEILGVVPTVARYQRTGARKWRVSSAENAVEFGVDQWGLPQDIDGRYRRIQ